MPSHPVSVPPIVHETTLTMLPNLLPRNSAKNLLTVFSNFLSKSRGFSRTVVRKQDAEERKVNVDGFDINFLKVGNGKPVLLLPGAIGTIWTDFKPQIENLDRQSFTVVAWEPPGYGKSRPPNRTFPEDFLHRDADWAHKLMKELGYERFSMIGWSDGGITAMIISGTHPESIERQVLLAANSHVSQEDADIYIKYQNIDSMSEKMLKPYIDVYGEEYFRKAWSDWVEGVLKIKEKRDGDLCKDMLPKIKCPTLIVQGVKDALCPMKHASYLMERISGAKLKIFEKGAHNLHLRYPEEFNALVTEFLKAEDE